ncbi:hypothetical protein DUNSADRAFT_7728 [Dunaliella salina]|uniref:Encoded protein n=1 Tax=Dunaliella salina TaxID=3046 RepID=A0ABQ7GKV4_DUNSA|nr:hypothetical protein DUNSADRAFT_7728 [Dunaliella salina]|eukprot:KAF5835239.1 hypothetical protein DUNSADRAFT_7728 [Dunaliella salina]
MVVLHSSQDACITGTEAEVPGEHAITPDQMMKESSSYVKRVKGNYTQGRAGMSTYGTDLVNETSQNTAGMGPVTATTVADISEEFASDVSAGAYGRPEPLVPNHPFYLTKPSSLVGRPRLLYIQHLLLCLRSKSCHLAPLSLSKVQKLSFGVPFSV